MILTFPSTQIKIWAMVYLNSDSWGPASSPYFNAPVPNIQIYTLNHYPQSLTEQVIHIQHMCTYASAYTSISICSQLLPNVYPSQVSSCMTRDHTKLTLSPERKPQLAGSNDVSQQPSMRVGRKLHQTQSILIYCIYIIQIIQ